MIQTKKRDLHALGKTAMLMAVVFFLCRSVTGSQVSTDSGCSKWRDSLVIAGIRCLDSGKIAQARHYFAGAFKCGMRIDSMHFFIGESYLRQGALDTAMVYNRAVEEAPMFPRPLWILQRAKILWLLGRKQGADSLMQSLQPRNRHDFTLGFSGKRHMMTLNPFTFIPQHLPLNPGLDIDDAGGQSLYYRYTRTRGARLPWFLQFTASSFLPVPGSHFMDEGSDTLFQSCGVTAGLGSLGTTIDVSAGFQWNIHQDGKTDRYPSMQFTLPLNKKTLLMVSHNQKWTDVSTLDNFQSDLSLLRISAFERWTTSFSLTLAHHFTRSDIYQSRFDSSGIYRPLPKAYITMDAAALADTTQPAMRYFSDAACTQPFGILLRNEWNRQPSMYFMTAPEYDCNATLKYSITRMLPFGVSINANAVLQGIYYLKKVTWYTTDNTVLSRKTPESVFRNCAMVYNIADATYYLATDRTQSVYYTDKLFALHYHEKTRIDGYFIVSSTIRKKFGVGGDLYGTASFIKGFSTLTNNDPMVTFNHAWEFTAGWKKDITVRK